MEETPRTQRADEEPVADANLGRMAEEIRHDLSAEGSPLAGFFNMIAHEFENDISNETELPSWAEAYLVQRLTALKRANLEDMLNYFVIQSDWQYQTDHRITIPMTRLVAAKIVEVFRHYHQRGHVWSNLYLEDCLQSNEHMLWVVHEAKEMGLFYGVVLGRDTASTAPPDSRILNEFLQVNPWLDTVIIVNSSFEIFQAIRDCLKTIPSGVNVTRLTHLSINCNIDEDFSHLLPLLTEGLISNDSILRFWIHPDDNRGRYRPDDDGKLANLLKALPTGLESLRLGDYLMTEPLQEVIIQRLIQPDCRLWELGLVIPYNPPLTYDKFDFVSFAAAMKRNKSLKVLEFYGYKCSSNEVLSLLNALPDGSPLESLCIQRAELATLEFEPASISASHSLENLDLDLENDVDDSDESQHAERSRQLLQTQQSLVEVLKAIPSLSSLGRVLSANRSFCSVEAAVLCEFNRITQGHLSSRFSKAIPLCLWSKLINNADALKSRQYQDHAKWHICCKASVIFCLLRNHAADVVDCRRSHFIRKRSQHGKNDVMEQSKKKQKNKNM